MSGAGQRQELRKMKGRFSQYICVSASLAGWVFALAGCSTAEVSPHPAPQALPPPYVQVPHPVSQDLADLRAIFHSGGAPKLEELQDCDADFKKLKSATTSNDEHVLGSRELVLQDPVKYHWCFYGKILTLEESLTSESYLSDRQKKVLEVYSFLTPIGRAFMQEFHDSRYMRWAVRHYRRLSEWVFYRKLEMSPQATSELVEATNPFGLLREPASSKPVLEKYNIVKPVAPPPAAPLATEPAPLSSPSPLSEPASPPGTDAATQPNVEPVPATPAEPATGAASEIPPAPAADGAPVPVQEPTVMTP